jgi:2-phospho-L-lactate guanylyltransferase
VSEPKAGGSETSRAGADAPARRLARPEGRSRGLVTAWALIPAKAFDRGKSRLAPVLGAAARAAFARRLFDHVVATAMGVLDGVLVATDSDEVAAAARAHGAAVRFDEGPGPLAAVVDAGLALLAARGASAALVLMADLPRITTTDVRAVLEALKVHDVAIVADVHGRHTNALALAPPNAIATRFGAAQSFADHCAAARAAGLRLAVLANDNIAFDVDAPEDHALIVRS